MWDTAECECLWVAKEKDVYDREKRERKLKSILISFRFSKSFSFSLKLIANMMWGRLSRTIRRAETLGCNIQYSSSIHFCPAVAAFSRPYAGSQNRTLSENRAEREEYFSKKLLLLSLEH